MTTGWTRTTTAISMMPRGGPSVNLATTIPGTPAGTGQRWLGSWQVMAAETRTGVAPGARIMALRAEKDTENMRQTEAAATEAIQYAVKNGADIINYSNNFRDDDDRGPPAHAMWRTAVEDVMDSTVLFVGSARNDGETKPEPPLTCPPPAGFQSPLQSARQMTETGSGTRAAAVLLPRIAPRRTATIPGNCRELRACSSRTCPRRALGCIPP